VRSSELLRPSLKGVHVCISDEKGASGDTAMAEPLAEARDIIATCRESWGVVHSTQSTSAGVDETALAVYSTAVEALENLGH
jgi:hypothetical protein